MDYMTLFVGNYEGAIRDAFDTACRELDLDLLLLYGRGIGEPDPSTAAHNAVYDLLDEHSVDGLVAVSSCLTAYCGADGMAEFMKRYARLPRCSVGLELPGIPSVLVDHRAGMEAIVQHVVRDHRRQRVAFIGGPPGHADAESRLMAYRTVLDQHGIPLRDELVQSGHFVREGGRAAMERILTSGVEFDAVIVANDVMAQSAIDVLRAQGLRVPQDVAVTGFDDILLARLGSPPMTTVAQPFAAIAEHALATLTAQLEGDTPPSKVVLSPQLMLRRSCGCTAHSERKRLRRPGGAEVGGDAPRRDQAAIRAALEQVSKTHDFDLTRHADALVAALRRTLDTDGRAFLDTLEAILEDSGGDPECCHALQQGITVLREQFSSDRNRSLEDLWHDARELIALSNTRGQVQHRNRIDAAYSRMLSFGEQVSSALDLPSLKSMLAKSLLAARIRTAWLSRFTDATNSQLEPIITLVNGEASDESSTRFDASELIPPEARAASQRRTLLVFPMVCETHNYGVAAFEYADDVNGYQLIRDQVSAALRTVKLHQEVLHKTILHERSVQERSAAAKRMQSLSVLAGGVAHDLNNALGPLVGLPDVMLTELERLRLAPTSVGELRTDLETIRASTLRAAQTIKDLLTLSRQGRTAKDRLDLNQVVQDLVAGEALRALREGHPHVRIICDPAAEPLLVCGSEAHIGRALINLLKNAVEAVGEEGDVRVEISGLTLRQTLSGHETVEPGEYAVVVVSDDGIGIPARELEWVFEPFTSTKRVSESSGTGLGLAIVHGVVKEHEGFVNVESTAGTGTTFTLYFPRVAGSVLPALATSAPPRGSARILVVDDEPIQLRTARRILTSLGYTVQTVSSGTEALARFDAAEARGESLYDLVLLDMMLNDDMDGLQTFEAIRQRHPAQRAIIVSGHAPTHRVEHAFAQGLGWLAKPYTADALGKAVRDVLSRHGTDTSQRPSLRVPRVASRRPTETRLCAAGSSPRLSEPPLAPAAAAHQGNRE